MTRKLNLTDSETPDQVLLDLGYPEMLRRIAEAEIKEKNKRVVIEVEFAHILRLYNEGQEKISKLETELASIENSTLHLAKIQNRRIELLAILAKGYGAPTDKIEKLCDGPIILPEHLDDRMMEPTEEREWREAMESGRVGKFTDGVIYGP